MPSREQLEAALADPAPVTAAALTQTALAALDHDLCEQVAARIELALAAGNKNDHKLWQVLGLARRGLQDSACAHQAFQRAAELAPRDPLVAHSLARTALEAGQPSTHYFDRAHWLAPSDAAVLLGRAAAQLSEGRAEMARAKLAAVLDANPGWIEGHVAFAKITASGLPGASPVESIHTALARFPRDPSLWFALIRTAIEAGDHAAAIDWAREARAALGYLPELVRIEGVCYGELGDPERALAMLATLPVPTNSSLTLAPLRNLIRLGRFDKALELAERRFDPQQDLALWPYRALLWRITGDARWHWLEGDPRMIGVYDISSEMGNLTDLIDLLRGLHQGVGQPLDQSVRRGSQTDGNLLARAEPSIRKLRAVILDTVQDYIAQLPQPDGEHPTLFFRGAPLRVAGAWSVRLADAGFHIDHVHQSGWISSCLYLALPEGDGGIGGEGGEDGWLTLGECRSLLPELDAFRMVVPQVGRLVLFPSLTWHGTRPFSHGERLTVAFDIARPRYG